MSETKKPVGLRLPIKLWEDLKQYGLEHHPSDKGSEGFDVTHTIATLLAQALGTSLDNSLATHSNSMSDERITEIINERLNELLSPMLYKYLGDDTAEVSKLLDDKITAIVDSKLGVISTGLETYTQQQCEAVRDELKKLSAIG
jgi:hypothetical protein